MTEIRGHILLSLFFINLSKLLQQAKKLIVRVKREKNKSLTWLNVNVKIKVKEYRKLLTKQENWNREVCVKSREKIS